jgi:triphosphatase
MAGHEFELRFAADEKSLSRLRRNAELKAMTVGPVRTRREARTYHDTPDSRLFAGGITWAVKRQGRGWAQAIQAKNGGLWHEPAAEAPLNEPAPNPGVVFDADLAGKVKSLLKGKELAPRVETEIRRTERRLMTPGGDIVDLVLRTGEVTAGDAKDQCYEVELDLKAGTPASVFEIARPLAKELPLTVSLEDAADHGFRLLKGGPPGKAPWLVLPADASAAEALTAILAACLKHIGLHAADACACHRSEAIHQIRVGLRRMRAALGAYAHAFGSDELRALGHRARDLASALAPARDYDVFIEDVLGAANDVVSTPEALARLTQVVEERRKAAWRDACAALAGPDYRLFLLDAAKIAVCGFTAASDAKPPAAMPARELAADVLGRRLGKVRNLAERLGELSVEERHELRKELKKLRYPSEFFASLFDAKGVKRYFVSLTALQDDLGQLNDLATARTLLQDVVHELGEAESREEFARVALTAGEIIGWHAQKSDKAMKRIAKHWAKFDSAGAFWRKG